MAKKFKNSNVEQRGPKEFVCGNDPSNTSDFRKLSNRDIKKLTDAESNIKQKRNLYRNTKAQRINPPYVTHQESDILYIPLAFHQFINTGATDNQNAITNDVQKRSTLYRNYDPNTKTFSGLYHRSAFNPDFYQAVVNKLNGYMSGEATAMTDDNYLGNAINNIAHGVESKIRFILSPALPVKFFTEYLTARYDDIENLMSTPYSEFDTYGLNSAAQGFTGQIIDQFELPYFQNGLNGRTSFNYTNSELEAISTAAANAYDQAFLVYDSLLSQTMATENLTQEEAIEFIANTAEAQELQRTWYINNLKGLVPCGPSGAVLTYDLNVYSDVCKLVEMHSASSGEYVNCTDLTECEQDNCPKDFPFAYMTYLNPTDDNEFLAIHQNARLGHMLPTHNVWTYLSGVRTSSKWQGLGPEPTDYKQGNLYMSSWENFDYDVDTYAQVLLHELGHTFGMPHTFQGGIINDKVSSYSLVNNAASYTIPKFSVPLSKEDAENNGGDNLLVPSENDAQYIKSIHKTAQTLGNATSNTQSGGNIKYKIGFPTTTITIGAGDEQSTYELKKVSEFQNEGFGGFSNGLRSRRRLIYHLLNTGVFWGNVDPDQNNKLVFNRVLREVHSADIFNDFNYYVNNEIPSTPLSSAFFQYGQQLVLEPDSNYSGQADYSLVLFDSADSKFDNIKDTVFTSKNIDRTLYVYFSQYDRDITFAITYGGVKYEIQIDPTETDEDGNQITYPVTDEYSIPVSLYTATLPADTEKVALTWSTSAERSVAETWVAAVDFEYKYRPVDVLTRVPFCKIDSNGDPTDVFDEFWWFNLNWIDEDYPAYPDNWPTSKIYDEFDDDGNSLCPCLYTTQYYDEPVGDETLGTYTSVQFTHQDTYPYNNVLPFMQSFEKGSSKWARYFYIYADYYSVSSNPFQRIHENLWVRYHTVHSNLGNMGHAPIFGNYGYSPIAVMPRVFAYELEAVLPELQENGTYLTFAVRDNLQPDIPREHTAKLLSPSGNVNEKYTEFFNKLGVGDTNPELETYNPYRIEEFDEESYPNAHNFIIDKKVDGFSTNITVENNNTFLGTPVNINWMYNAMDYSGKPYMFIDGRWGTDSKDVSVVTNLGNNIVKRRTLFSPEGIFRIESTVEVGLGKWGAVRFFGETVKDLDAGSTPIQGLLDQIETYIQEYQFNEVVGCTDSSAVNYNPSASINDGSCVYEGPECDLGDPVYIPVCTDSNVTTCNPADQAILDTFFHEIMDVSDLQYSEEMGYPEPPEGCTGGGFKYIKHYPGSPYGNEACEYGILEATGCAGGQNLTEEELIALGPEYYTLVCPDQRYTITSNLYTLGDLYYTSDGESYIGLYCFRNDNLVYAGTLNNPGERLYTAEDLKSKPSLLLESEAKNFNKIKTSIENICRFVNL